MRRAKRRAVRKTRNIFGDVTAGEVYYVWPIPAGGVDPDRFIRLSVFPYGDLFQKGGIKGDVWISKVKITDTWHDSYGNRIARVLRIK